MPGRGVALVDGDVVEGVVEVDGVVVEVDGVDVDVDLDVDGSTVSVVVLTDGGGTASVDCDGAPLSRLPDISCAARTTATPNNAIVATTSATWVGPNRDFRCGFSGGRTSCGYGM